MSSEIILNGISLPSSLVWVNEFNEQLVSQNTQRTLAGSTVIFHGKRTNGIPITLASGSDYGWTKRSVVVQLKEFVKQAGLIMPLVVKGQSFNVVFDHQKGALAATSIYPYADPQSDHFCRININLITV